MHSFFEKISVFNSIVFNERYHKYTFDGKPTISVTKVTGSVLPPFDEMAKAAGSAAKYNKLNGTHISPEEMITLWKVKNLISREKGTAVHAYIENAMANKFTYYPTDHIRHVFGDALVSEVFPFDKFMKNTYGNLPMRDIMAMPCVQFEYGTAADLVKPKYDIIINHVKSFINDIRGKMHPVRSELVIGSPKYLVCGMIDQIFYNEKSHEFEIWDWKTNTELDVTSTYYLNAPLSNVPQSKLDEYSLQLACYKKIFTEMTGIPLGKSYLCWFSEANTSYKCFQCKDYAKEADVLLETFGLGGNNG